MGMLLSYNKLLILAHAHLRCLDPLRRRALFTILLNSSLTELTIKDVATCYALTDGQEFYSGQVASVVKKVIK